MVVFVNPTLHAFIVGFKFLFLLGLGTLPRDDFLCHLELELRRPLAISQGSVDLLYLFLSLGICFPLELLVS